MGLPALTNVLLYVLYEAPARAPVKLSCKFKTVENSDFDKMIELLDKMGCDLEL